MKTLNHALLTVKDKRIKSNPAELPTDYRSIGDKSHFGLYELQDGWFSYANSELSAMATKANVLNDFT